MNFEVKSLLLRKLGGQDLGSPPRILGRPIQEHKHLDQGTRRTKPRRQYILGTEGFQHTVDDREALVFDPVCGQRALRVGESHSVRPQFHNTSPYLYVQSTEYITGSDSEATARNDLS